MSGSRYQWCWELYIVCVVGRNGVRDGFVIVIRIPHGDTLLAGFVELQ